MSTEQSVRRTVRPPVVLTDAQVRSRSGSPTPPSSPGSQGSLDNGSMGSGSSQSHYTPVLREKTKRKRKRVKEVEDSGKTRFGRFVLTLMCYSPFFWLWGMRMPSIVEELGSLHFLPTAILVGCVSVACMKEFLQLHRMSLIYPLLSFGIGIVGGCYSSGAMRDQQWLRLFATCAHGIFAGQLRGLSKQTGTTSPLNPLGGFVFWLCMGEVACMVWRDFVDELTVAALSYGGFMLAPVVAGVFPAVIVTLWVKLFGVEKISTMGVDRRGFLSRCASATVWAFTAFMPLLIAGFTMCATLYVLLPWVWGRMLFVAPWGVLLEFGSALSCGGCSKSLFYSEPITLPPLRHEEDARRAVVM